MSEFDLADLRKLIGTEKVTKTRNPKQHPFAAKADIPAATTIALAQTFTKDGERLTKQEAYILAQAIREYIFIFLKERGQQGRISVADVRSAFGAGRCKEGFARGRLNEMVAAGLLTFEQVHGFRSYFFKQGKPVSDSTIVNNSEAIDLELLKCKNELSSLQQKIDCLEEAKKLFLDELNSEHRFTGEEG